MDKVIIFGKVKLVWKVTKVCSSRQTSLRTGVSHISQMFSRCATYSLLNESVDLPNNCTLPCKPLTTELHQLNTTTLKQRISNFIPKLMVTNVRSLAPKIDEVREFMMENEINLSFLTETWLNDSITDSVVSIPGFTIIRKDISINNHGGICIYIRDGDTKLKILSEISCCSEHEILWLHIKPRRLPREFSSIIVAVLYHPPVPTISACRVTYFRH